MEPNVPVSSQPEVINTAPILNQIPGQLEGPVSLFSSSWKFFKANWRKLAPIVIAPTTAIYLGQIFIISKNPILMPVAFVLIVAGIIFCVAMQPAAINAIQRLSTESGAVISFKEQYKFGFKYFWSIILLVIITMPIFFGSGVLFIIPAIIIGGYTGMYIFALVLDGKKGFSALTESFSLVKGRWWKTFGRLAFLVLVYFAGSIIIIGISSILKSLLSLSPESTTGESILSIILSLIWMSVMSPLAIVYTYKLYNSLKATRLQNVSTAGFKKWLVTFLVIGIIAIISIPIIGEALFISTLGSLKGARLLNQPIPYTDSQGIIQGNRPGGAGPGPDSNLSSPNSKF